MVTQNEEEQVSSFNPLTENILMEIDEKVSCQISKDGELEKFELKGIVYVTLTDQKKLHPEVQFSHYDHKGIVFKVHPEFDKQSWNKQKLLRAKEGTDGEGLSSQTKLDALRYRYTSKNEEDLTFKFSIFNSKKQGKNVVSIELEYN